MFKLSIELKRVNCPQNLGLYPYPITESEIWDAIVEHLPINSKYSHHILDSAWEPNGKLVQYKSIFPDTTSNIGDIVDGDNVYTLHIYYEKY